MATIQIGTDKLITLAEACRLLPSRPSPATLWRWRVKGVNGTKLECVRVGNRWYTTRAAMSRFISQQTAAVAPAADDELAERSAATARRLGQAGLL